ncbi:unnamed protein product [Paramecium octaurelia]|uniref:Uncharacterized protein n=1 Tax=Paramecium octaurelia TaxID=43137 RepID=A0A8S1WNU6_PAROT|nr:unnamed protein product [Paramecium octaurelia]
MINLFYDCEEVYSYENKELLEKVLEFDSIGEVNLDESNNSITYKINRREFIRLRDLIFWIESGFVRIHLGQLLHLMLLLLYQTNLIESQGIDHDYLDLTRIWLHLRKNSQHPSLIYQYLQYSIHFTGYQCPFYQSKYPAQKASIKVKEIIQIIFNRCFNSIQLKWTNENKRKEIYDQIVKPIMGLCQSNSNNINIITCIQDKMKQFNYQEDIKKNCFQLLDIDDYCNDYVGSKRQKSIPKVNEDLTSILSFGSQYGQVTIEYLLSEAIPMMSQHLESYSKIKFDYFQKAQKQHDEIYKNQRMLKDQIQKQVLTFIQQELKEKEKEYKFDITQEDIKQLQDEIISSIFQSPYIKYFQNTYWINPKNQDFNTYQLSAVSKFILSDVQEKVNLLFTINILKLINDLI